MKVTIDGIEYTPTQDARIGVAVTTHNRPDVLKRALAEWHKHLPLGAVFVVVDDASIPGAQGATFRFDKPVGVAWAKNKCLELLMDVGVDHLFLFDDDCWPQVYDWWKPYVQGPEPHYSHSWNLYKIYEDESVVATSVVGGSCVYYERRVIEDVGGMRNIFGTWGCEHVNLSDRIYNRGWTTWRYQDVPAAYNGKLFYELDRLEPKTHKTSATQEQFRHNQQDGRKLWMSMLDDAEYVPYRQPRRVVLTDLYTKVPDPQRGSVTGLTEDSIRKLATSVDAPLVVFTDIDKPKAMPGVSWVLAPCVIRTDFQRWVNAYQWLREHPEIDQVWHVDGTDVEMTNSPWDTMKPGTLYAGSEPETLQSVWLRKSAPDKAIQDFCAAHPTHTLLNAGLAGGSRDDVLRLALTIVHLWCDDQIDKIQCWEKGELGTDMSAFNLACYTRFAGRLSYGPHVNNTFRSNTPGTHAWWRHK